MRSKVLGLGAFMLGFAATGLLAHHSFEAEFDTKKPVTLKGTVTKFEWDNPHVLLFVDVKDSGGQIVNWALEFAAPSELRHAGWTRESLKVGDQITVEGSLARDGSRTAAPKSVAVAGKRLTVPGVESVTPPLRAGGASKSTPRWPDGHPRLGPEPKEKGYWVNVSNNGLAENSAGNIRMNSDGLLANIADAGKVAPFQPWAKGLYEYRQKTLLRDDPMASCLPSGGPRQFQDRHGLQIVEQPDRKRIFIMSGGANRNWRLIYLDGRALPDSEDVSPTYFGYSVGSWEGDTLIVNAHGFTERFWFTNGGLPHTEGLRLTERISRPDFNTLKYEVTVTDPGTYTRPWTGGWSLQWVPDADLAEYFCQDNDVDPEHLAGR